ncbi:nucleotidyl transferase AbiEii/AbiGii toxin family protein [Chitinophaga japonensis]|uniref:Putative nucleotidyltransferase n=1 Tax=Chitinophaga japonensis TaxID=104662 RepID=A0A562TF13_CHIJA|nr:nucleotidyl transferase AbiEii/AbiGii toxin family protein [Chitinophaga japonensis]TWI92127.1 putative nucleotidyltransferase [Chitinophaga japonensis]
MNLINVREEELKDIFDVLEEVFRELKIDYYLIGAVARDIWYSRGNKQFRRTKDVDFAVMVGSQREYEVLRGYLKMHKGFIGTRENSFVLISSTGIQVDILPFGDIAGDTAVRIEGMGLTNIQVDGFVEVYKSGIAGVELTTGHHFKVATLPAIILLKLIAFDDRPEIRFKDARDIANILEHYFELQADFIYGNHLDLFDDNRPSFNAPDLSEISGIVIGREIKRITAGNEQLQARLVKILQTQIGEAENSSFVRNMVAETGSTVEEALERLNSLLTGMDF